MSDISALGSVLRFWDWFGYASTALVFIGVIGESVVELTNWVKLPERKRRIGKASALVLILGLAGELISGFKISGITGEITASLNKEAGDARRDANQAKAQSDSFQAAIANANARAKSAEAQVASANAASRDAVAKVANADARIAEANRVAAEANQIAESERLARVKIEERLAGWSLEPEAQARLTDRLKPFAKTPFDLSVNPAEARFMEILDGILTKAGWSRQQPKPSGPSRPGFLNIPILVDGKAGMSTASGISVGVAQERFKDFKAAAESLVSGLIAEGIPVELLQSADPSAIHIVIGNRE